MDTPAGSGALPSPVAQTSLGAQLLTSAEQAAVMARVTMRLLPLLLFCYIIAYIDRINVGFAKLQFRDALGVDPAVFDRVFGLGAGMFFIGYFFFEVPSNLILQRVGARVWIARIMILWGLVSMAFMFTKGVTMFYVMRFLLGAAEAGFFPGVILYLTYWYPAKERARAVALFAVGGVAAGVIGSPISGALLGLDGVGGLAGWQWLFFVEALPAVMMGFVVLFVLPNRPQEARWLSENEKAWIQARLDAEAAATDASRHSRLKDVFTSGQVWLLCGIYFLQNMGGYGYQMWLPTIVKGLSGQSDLVVGFINAIPYVAAGVVMMLYGRHSDRTGERRGHVAFAAFIAAVGFVVAASSRNPWLAMTGLTLAFVGMKSVLGPFWALSTGFLRGTAAAGGIAFINSVGNLGGAVGPDLVGRIKSATGSEMLALYVLGAGLLAMSLLTLAVRGTARDAARDVKREA